MSNKTSTTKFDRRHFLQAAAAILPLRYDYGTALRDKDASQSGSSTMRQKSIESITLNNGVKMPILGSGTFGLMVRYAKKALPRQSLLVIVCINKAKSISKVKSGRRNQAKRNHPQKAL